MGVIQDLVEKTKELTPEQRQVFLNALGIHQESDPALRQPDLQIDGYERWESQLTHQEYIFGVFYLQSGLNQAKAAKLAGIHPAYASRIVNHNANLRQFISQHINRMAMDPPEMLFHLARMVRISKGDAYNPDTGEFDIKLAIQTGAIEKIKSIRKDEKGYQVTWEENSKFLDILTKTAGLQKDIKITGDIGDVARAAGMREDEIQKHKAMIEEKARLLKDLIKHGENIDMVVVESDS